MSIVLVLNQRGREVNKIESWTVVLPDHCEICFYGYNKTHVIQQLAELYPEVDLLSVNVVLTPQWTTP